MAQGDNEVCEDEGDVRGQNADEKTVARRGFGLGHESCPVSSLLPWATAASQAVAVETPNGVSGHKALKSQQPASEAVQPCAVEHGVPALGCLAGSGQSQTASMALNSLRSSKVNHES